MASSDRPRRRCSPDLTASMAAIDLRAFRMDRQPPQPENEVTASNRRRHACSVIGCSDTLKGDTGPSPSIPSPVRRCRLRWNGDLGAPSGTGSPWRSYSICSLFGPPPEPYGRGALLRRGGLGRHERGELRRVATWRERGPPQSDRTTTRLVFLEGRRRWPTGGWGVGHDLSGGSRGEPRFDTRPWVSL
jgi:hypothetical protein